MEVYNGLPGYQLRFAKIWLMGALTVIPAAIARNAALGMRRYILTAVGIGAAISLVGAVAADFWKIRPGPTIILLGAALFAFTLLGARRHE